MTQAKMMKIMMNMHITKHDYDYGACTSYDCNTDHDDDHEYI